MTPDARRVLETWNAEVAPYSRAGNISLTKPWPNVLERLEGSLEALGVEAWIDALRRLFPLRGLMEQGRCTIGRLATPGKDGISMIEKLLQGEYDRWTEPTISSPSQRPSLGEVIAGTAPADWLLCPPDVIDRPSPKRCMLYCARMSDHSPYLLAWLIRATARDIEHKLFTDMHGILDPIIVGVGP